MTEPKYTNEKKWIQNGERRKYNAVTIRKAVMYKLIVNEKGGNKIFTENRDYQKRRNGKKNIWVGEKIRCDRLHVEVELKLTYCSDL